jgi:hypothetical protein
MTEERTRLQDELRFIKEASQQKISMMSGSLLEGQANECSLNEVKENLSQIHSFSTNYATDWEKLSKTCSSMSQMSEAAKLLL